MPQSPARDGKASSKTRPKARAAEERRQRLAAALRANLKKRKARQQAGEAGNTSSHEPDSDA